MAFYRETARASLHKFLYDFAKLIVGWLWLGPGSELAVRYGVTGVRLVAVLIIPLVAVFLFHWWRLKPTDELTLHSAEYGFGGEWSDVLLSLMGYQHSNRITDVRVHHETFKIRDPYRQQEKILKVVYSIGNGRQQTVVRHENDTLTLPED